MVTIKLINQFKIIIFIKNYKKGRPIYIERIGTLKIDEIFKITTEERLIRYYV